MPVLCIRGKPSRGSFADLLHRQFLFILSPSLTGDVPKAWDTVVSKQSIKKIRDIADVVLPGHDRILKVTDDQIIAMTSLHETIIIPTGVADKEKPTRFELIIEANSATKTQI